MAEKCGLSHSSYGHYEQRIKRPFLPMEKAELFASVLSAYGIPRAEVLSLAGHAETADQDTPKDMLRVCVIGDDALSEVAFDPSYLRSVTPTSTCDLAVFTVNSDSMEPTFRKGDIVLVDKTRKNIGVDGVFAMVIGGSTHIKRVARSGEIGRVHVISDNKAYGEQTIPVSEIEVIGRVIWTGHAV